MERWEWILMAIAGYAAVVLLVRLMNKRREDLVEHMRKQIDAEKERREQEERRKRRMKRRKKRAA